MSQRIICPGSENTMKMVLLDGALCNQMTQYIFARCLQEELSDTNELVILDDLWFYCQHGLLGDLVAPIEHHEYQLDKFPNLYPVIRASEYFDNDVWNEIVKIARSQPPLAGGSYLPQILKDNGLDFFMIAETQIHQFDGMIAHMPYYHYIPEMLQSQGNVYYFGWFTNGGWFKRHEQMFLHELSLPPLWQRHDLEMEDKIRNTTAISVHIRRGGYAATNRATPTEYFTNAIDQVLQHLRKNKKTYKKQPCFFIFSDEIEWVKKHSSEYGLHKIPYPVIYCQADRTIADNHCDLQLMSQCDIMILEFNSVYSYMAALFNQKENKIVINPNKGRGVF